MERPKGAVKFAYGAKEQLPQGAEEVELYMVSGDPTVYVCPKYFIEYKDF